MAQQQQAIHKFVLGNKEFEGKTAEFQYDRGWYSITDIMGENREIIYKSRNAQEAYMKWNVYIGRKKERPVNEDRSRNAAEKPDSERIHSERNNLDRNNPDKSNHHSDKRSNDRTDRDRNGSRERQNNRNRRNEHSNGESSFGREERRDRRRNRADRSRRDREAVEE